MLVRAGVLRRAPAAAVDRRAGRPGNAFPSGGGDAGTPYGEAAVSAA